MPPAPTIATRGPTATRPANRRPAPRGRAPQRSTLGTLLHGVAVVWNGLAHGVGTENHVDHVGSLALRGTLTVELAQAHERLVRLRETALAFEQYRSQCDRRW